MSYIVKKISYMEPPFCKKEILRYAGCRESDDDTESLLEDCIREIREKLSYEVCFMELPLHINEEHCDFEVFSVNSKQLSANLKGCSRVLLLAATVGVELDRAIAKYGRIAPSKALMYQAIGAERIESLCNLFCKDISDKTGYTLKPRFSPGYGDLELAIQKQIFDVLQCQKQIGLFLNNSLLMSPSKSVTAFAGMTKEKTKEIINQCSLCNNRDCEFRGVL